MASHVHPDVQVARRPAALARRALALQLDPLPVSNSGRDAGLDSPRAQRTSAAAAGGARVIDYQATATAGGARLGERAAAAAATGLAGALARPASPWHGASV